MYNFDPYNVFFNIATNIPVLLKTAFVLQGHIWSMMIKLYEVAFIKFEYSVK